jgi:hypothetical protein
VVGGHLLGIHLAPPKYNPPQRRYLVQRGDQPFQQLFCTIHICLYNGEITIAINRQSWQPIAFAKQPAVGCAAGVAQRHAQLPGRAHTIA